MEFNLNNFQQSDLLDSVNDLMTILDLELRIQWANRAAGESVGEDPKNLLGWYCYQVWQGSETPCEECPVQSTIRTGMHHKSEVESPSGKVFLVKSYPLRTSAGELSGITEVTVDITDYRKSEEALRHKSEEQTLLLETIPTQIWYLTDVETYGAVNQAHADFFGLRREEMEYRNLWDFLTQEKARICHDGNIQVFETGEQIYTEEWLQNAEGKQRLIAITKTPKLDATGNVEYVVCSGSDITEKKQAKEALKLSEKRYRSLVESQQDCIARVDTDGLFTYVNDVCCQVFERKREDLLRQPFVPFVHEEDLEDVLQKLETVRQPPYRVQIIHRLVTPSGFYWMHWENSVIFDNHGEIVEIQSVGRDLTELKRSEHELKEIKERFDFALQATNTGMWDWNVQTGDVVFNEQWAAMVGYSLEELKPLSIQTWMDLCHPDDLEASNSLVKQHMDGETEIYQCEARMRHKQGHWIWILDRGQIIEWDESGNPLRMIGTHTDITESKEAEERLRFLATMDELTNMWNRRRFIQAIKDELERAHRYQEIFSLLMLDIDYFKVINDTYGHGAGDEVLRHIAYLIRQGLRQVDMPGRFGGEEFAIILPHVDLNAAYATAERLRQCIENTPAVYNRIEIPFSVSIGVATYQEGIKNEDEIYKLADDALYEAKRKGRNITMTTSGHS